MNKINLPRLIVVADDDIDICNLVAMQLKRAGFKVLVAHDGQAALDLINEQHPDLALLDIMMPKMSGLEVAKHVHANPENSDTKIVMVSARAQSSINTITDDVDALAITDYVSKPFNMKDLVQRITDITNLLPVVTKTTSPC